MSPAYWADIIHEAAQSELGLLALTILVVAAVAFAFFRKASEYVRLAVFLMILVSAVLFGSAIVRILGTPRNSSATSSPQALIAGSAEALRAVQNVTVEESRFYWRVLMENPERSAVLQRSVLLALEARRRGGGSDAERALRDALVLLSRPATRVEPDGPVAVVGFSWDGRYLVTGSPSWTSDSGYAWDVRIWDAATGRQTWRISSIELLALSSDGHRLTTATGGTSRVIRGGRISRCVNEEKAM